jgi:hypothetical protein
MESLNVKFVPPEYIKVGERLSINGRAIKGRNIILTHSSERIEEDSLIFLGKVLEHTPIVDYFGFNVWLDVSYPFVILVPGRRGTGKSYTLGILAEGLILTKDETPITTKKTRHSVVVIDTLGQFWQMKYKPNPNDYEGKKQLRDLTSWGLTPLAINEIQVFTPRGLKIREDWKEFSIKFCEVEVGELAGLLDVDLYQDRMGQLLLHLYQKVEEGGYQSAYVDEDTNEVVKGQYVSIPKDFDIDDLIKCIDSDYEIISKTTGFEVQTRRALRNRLMVMRKWKIFSEEGTSINEIVKEGNLTIIDLEGADQDLRNLVVAVLTRKIFQARSEARKLEKIAETGELKDYHKTTQVLKPLWLIIDEAHEYCPAVGRTAAKEPLIRYAKEGRSIGLGLIMATQQPSALSEKISSQTEIVISHALAFANDIQSLVNRLVNKKVDEFKDKIESHSFEDQIRLIPPGTAFVSAVNVSSVFLLVLRPRLTMHGGKAPRMG